MRRASLATALLASLGCAGVPRGGGAVAWTFPRSYEANQIVVVDLRGTRRELLASVRRSGEDVDVTLFDAALAVPLIAGRIRQGTAEETRYVESVPAGYGERLVRMLADLHRTAFSLGADGAGEADGAEGRYRVASLPPGGDCRFPAVIDVTPRGPGPRIRVTTLDVGCDPSAPAAQGP